MKWVSLVEKPREGVTALEQCSHEIMRRANLAEHPLTAIFGQTRPLLQNLIDFIGKSPVADLYKGTQKDDPQRELLTQAVTDLINPGPRRESS